MGLNRRQSAILIATLVFAGGAYALHAGQREIVVLRTFDGTGRDLFTTLWVVDDAEGFVWIRANRPDRRWLPHLTAQPMVELRRGEGTQHYVAKVFDDPATRAYVAPLFRRKYGLADRWREWSEGTDTVPVRLRPR